MVMLLWLAVVLFALVQGETLPNARPQPADRTFVSPAIDKLISELAPLLKTENLATMFSNCFPNTLDTTIFAYTDSGPDSFVITGDIPAMWLRDSQNLLMPYLPYVKQDAKLERLILGTINRQAHSILIDPYANAFNYNSSTASGQDHQSDSRKPKMQPSVFEGKYELDSIMSFLKLSYWYFREVGPEAFAKAVDTSASGNWARAVGSAVSVVAQMQAVSGQESTAEMPYLFERSTNQATDTLVMSGRGPPTNPTTGLSRQLFRPSDDSAALAFNIPGNAMACVELSHTLELIDALAGEAQHLGDLRGQVAAVRGSLCTALNKVLAQYKAADSPIPFEVDGYGSAVFMDDANVPSLLSLPVLGYMSTKDATYKATRSFVWSSRNPYFYSGPAGSGIGGPHEGPSMAWPMSLAVLAMTSDDEQEISACLDALLSTTAGTGLMHEAFDVHDSQHYTRPWFAWANGVFAELVLQLVHTHPLLVLRDADAVAQAQALVRVPVSLQAQLDKPIA